MMQIRNIAWEIQIRKDRMQRLIDYIHITGADYYGGCPRLMLYGFVKKEGLPTTWLHGAINDLKRDHVITEQIIDHYMVATYGQLSDVQYRKIMY